VVLTVSDTGTGIAPEIRERIFDPFFSTKKLEKGTGLGLATSLEIATSHGGFINVYSEVGKGTAFKLFIPTAPALGAPVAPTVEKPGPRGQGQVVLVVDDEQPIRVAARRTLEALGYRALEASNGAEALEIFAANSGTIALAIIDMSMPVMDGVATIQALRAREAGRALRIIAASGLGANGAFARAAAAGVTRFLEKPYTAASLLQVLQEALAD
jgi:CheY-like chemotaxis protein